MFMCTLTFIYRLSQKLSNLRYHVPSLHVWISDGTMIIDVYFFAISGSWASEQAAWPRFSDQ